MRTLLLSVVLLLGANALPAGGCSVWWDAHTTSIRELNGLSLKTTKVTLTHVYGEGLAALARLPKLESLEVRSYSY